MPVDMGFHALKGTAAGRPTASLQHYRLAETRAYKSDGEVGGADEALYGWCLST